MQKVDVPRIEALSQNCVANAFCDRHFKGANDQSIHGACPSDGLHSILFSTLKHTKKVFYEMLGPVSEKFKQTDAIAKIHCCQFTLTLDQSFPNADFSKQNRGGGKMMAKEHRGVALVMLAILLLNRGYFCSIKGREIMGNGTGQK